MLMQISSTTTTMMMMMMMVMATIMMIVDAVPIVNNNTDAFESQCSKVNINHPCRCETLTTTTTTTNVNKIQCDGEYEFNLNGQFKHRSSGNSQDDDLIIFDEFILNNTEISRLDDNLFGQRIRFKRIKLVDCLSLRHISSNTFQQSGPFIQEFIVQGESSLGEDQYASDLFDSMNSMINVEKIWLNRNRLRSIPTVAFGKQTGNGQGDRFARLKELNFNKFSSKNGHIKSVGNFAFYYLNQLQYLYLSHQRINYLPANSFDFEKSSNQTLYIYLGNNKLNNTSFERGIFLNSKRPIHLELYWNPDLTYLDEQIFRPFLEQNPLNRISLQDNPLQCDCQSYWLYKDRQKFSNQLQNIMCKIGPRQTFNIDLISFDKCHQNNQNNNGRKRNKLIVVN